MYLPPEVLSYIIIRIESLSMDHASAADIISISIQKIYPTLWGVFDDSYTSWQS
jgi:hypothetical protein